MSLLSATLFKGVVARLDGLGFKKILVKEWHLGFFFKCKIVVDINTLVTQPMMQRRSNPTELRLMEELFTYIFGIYIKFGYKNPSILNPFDSVDVAS